MPASHWSDFHVNVHVIKMGYTWDKTMQQKEKLSCIDSGF